MNKKQLITFGVVFWIFAVIFFYADYNVGQWFQGDLETYDSYEENPSLWGIQHAVGTVIYQTFAWVLFATGLAFFLCTSFETEKRRK
ncbi:MAG: hypothetical protein KKH88_00555 [Nanoarchaeota archaeon]|nr:hypothetical protein [Nanoarchaeota archaeon]